MAAFLTAVVRAPLTGIILVTEMTDNSRLLLPMLEPWLPFLDTYRTMCLAPQPDFRRVLEDVRAMQLAA
jgi:hypothetical protein